MLDSGCWVLGPGYWIVESWIMNGSFYQGSIIIPSSIYQYSIKDEDFKIFILDAILILSWFNLDPILNEEAFYKAGLTHDEKTTGKK